MARIFQCLPDTGPDPCAQSCIIGNCLAAGGLNGVGAAGQPGFRELRQCGTDSGLGGPQFGTSCAGISGDSRDAYGSLSPFRTQTSKRLPVDKRGMWILAPCNTDGVPAGEPWIDVWSPCNQQSENTGDAIPSCAWSLEFGLVTHEMFCTLADPDKKYAQKPVYVDGDTRTARTAFLSTEDHLKHSNLLCWGKAWVDNGQTVTEGDYISGPGDRFWWNICFIDLRQMRYVVPPLRGDDPNWEYRNPRIRELQNLALQTLANMRLDHPHPPSNFPNFDQINQPNEYSWETIDKWERSAIPDLSDPEEQRQLPKVADLNAKLLRSGCSLPCELVIVEAVVSMSLVFHTVYNEPTLEFFVYPSISFKVDLILAPRFSTLEDCRWRDNRVVDDEDPDAWVDVVIGGNPLTPTFNVPEERVIFLDDDGEIFTPPTRARWRGYVGPTEHNYGGLGGIPDWDPLPGENLFTECVAIANALGTYTVPARKTVYREDLAHPQVDNYAGDISIHFNPA